MPGASDLADGSRRTEVNFNVARSKSLTDRIDSVLARHYRFTEEELDYLINFDVKYRSEDEG